MIWDEIRWDEKMQYHGLKAGVQLSEEGWFSCQGQHSLLHHSAFNIIILDHHVLLQDLYGKQLITSLFLGQHHLRQTNRERERERVCEGSRDVQSYATKHITEAFERASRRRWAKQHCNTAHELHLLAEDTLAFDCRSIQQRLHSFSARLEQVRLENIQ